jgi:hypothetical protein
MICLKKKFVWVILLLFEDFKSKCEKNCTFSNILQKEKVIFLPISIILRLIPITFETLKPSNLDLLQVEQHVDQIVLEEAGRSSQLNDQVFGIRPFPGIGTNTFLACLNNQTLSFQ